MFQMFSFPINPILYNLFSLCVIVFFLFIILYILINLSIASSSFLHSSSFYQTLYSFCPFQSIHFTFIFLYSSVYKIILWNLNYVELIRLTEKKIYFFDKTGKFRSFKSKVFLFLFLYSFSFLNRNSLMINILILPLIMLQLNKCYHCSYFV